MNPFTPQSRPLILAGRSQQLGEIQKLLAATQLTGHAAEGGVILHGVRGIGKTSLLRTVADQAEDAGYVTVWISAAKRQPTLRSLIPAIQSALEDFDVIKPKDSWLLDTLSATLNLGFANLRADIKHQKKETEPIWDVGGLERLLRITTKKVIEAGKVGLLVFVDELHTVDNDELAVLLNALQNIAHDRRRSLPFMFLASGLPAIRGIATKAATFGERSTFIEIGRLDEQDTKIALAQPAVINGVGIDDAALDLIWQEAGGYPYFVQLYGYHIWETAHPDPGTILDVNDAARGVRAAHMQVMELFTARLDSLSKAERRFVEAMAKLGGDSPVRRNEVAEAIGKSTQAISAVRARLIDRAVITEENHGYLQFTVPGFADFILTQ